MLNHEKLKEKRAGARSGTTWKPKENENKIRVLPMHSRYLTEPANDVAIHYKMHFFRVEGRPTEVSLCLEELKQRCPACETWRVWRKTEDPALKEMVKSISPSDQYLFNILDIDNLAKGIQPWPANYTCWDKIIEIAAQPAWGNIDDPANGINFIVTLTPKNKSRTGFNSYSVMPEPQRTNVMPVLDAIPNWKDVLDSLEGNKNPPKSPDEIIGLLREMGFQVAGVPTHPVAPSPQPVAAYGAPMAAPPMNPTPQPVGMPQPLPVAPAAPAAITMPTAPAAYAAPMSYAAPATPAPAYGAPAPVAAPMQPAPAYAPAPSTMPPASATAVYDPGPGYEPKMADNQRPAGVPRCFSDYNPSVRPCRSCPVIADCQMKFMGMP